jgi:hypothetical protein
MVSLLESVLYAACPNSRWSFELVLLMLELGLGLDEPSWIHQWTTNTLVTRTRTRTHTHTHTHHIHFRLLAICFTSLPSFRTRFFCIHFPSPQ